MDVMGFNEFLRGREIMSSEESVELVNHFLTEVPFEDGFPSYNTFRKELTAFEKGNKLSKTDCNTLRIGLRYYGQFVKSGQLEYNMEKILGIGSWQRQLEDRLESRLGVAEAHRILTAGGDIKYSSSDKKKCKWTETMFQELDKAFSEEELLEVLHSNLHFLPPKRFENLRKKYEKTGDIDQLLADSRESFLNYITEKYGENSDYSNYYNNMENLIGTRVGNKIYDRKGPLHLDKYLAAETDLERRYYTCHCPWVRQSILEEDVNIPKKFCNCSAGFAKVMFDVIFGQPVKTKVIHSVLGGDDECLFEIEIPEEHMKKINDR